MPVTVHSNMVPLNIVRMNLIEKVASSSVCCVCKTQTGTFMPIQCFNYRSESNAHKICSDCWWDEEKGFAIEFKSHKCPGCKVK